MTNIYEEYYSLLLKQAVDGVVKGTIQQNNLEDIYSDILQYYIITLIGSNNTAKLLSSDLNTELIDNVTNQISDPAKKQVIKNLRTALDDMDLEPFLKEDIVNIIASYPSLTSKNVADTIIPILKYEMEISSELEALSGLGAMALVLKQEKKGKVTIQDLFNHVVERVSELENSSEFNNHAFINFPETTELKTAKENAVKLGNIEGETRQALEALLKHQ